MLQGRAQSQHFGPVRLAALAFLLRSPAYPAVVAGRPRGPFRAFRVACACGLGTHQVEQGVLLAVHANFHQVQEISGCFAFDPQLVSGSAPQHTYLAIQSLQQ